MTRVSKDIRDVLDGTNKDENEECYTIGETNSVNFIKADGSQQMFPYSQLITVWTEHTEEENVIKVFFSTHLVALKGHNLNAIYEHIREQNLVLVFAQNERYLKAVSEKNAFVKEIEIKWKNKEIEP